MTNLRSAAQQTLDALLTAQTGLEWYRGMLLEYVNGSDHEAAEEILTAITTLRAALAQATPEQDVRDAARYRFIRNPENSLGLDVMVNGLPEELDEAIDAALRSTTQAEPAAAEPGERKL